MGTKLRHIQTLLERRIRLGDYLLKELPGDRELAAETGVSRVTARKAVLNLIQNGMLQRDNQGRVTINRALPEQTLHLAFLAPCLSSADFERWRLSLDAAAGDSGTLVRTLLYAHWDDPVLIDALHRFDGVFLLPTARSMPSRIIDRLREASASVVILGQDLTDQGLRSVRLVPPAAVHGLLDLLAELGHRRIDCFNVQATDNTTEQHLDQWKLWRAVHRIPGQLLGKPVEGRLSEVAEAYHQMRTILARGSFKATALLPTTASAAVGAVRALHEQGLSVGQDVAIGVIDDQNLAPMFSPSLTSLRTPDPQPYLQACLSHMLDREHGWSGPLLIQPTSVPLFIGESTGPPAHTNHSKHRTLELAALS